MGHALGTDAARILFVGDMHLGRTPAGLPAFVDPGAVGPRAAWRRTVQWAVEHGVHGVVLAGDLVESLDDRWEGLAALSDAVARLDAAGIDVVAVAGNHDVRALPWLARQLGGALRVVGRGGRWEVVRLGPRGGAQVEVVGWSHHLERHECGPSLAELPERSGGVARIGVLHTQLDGTAYAPVSRAALVATGHPWLLGHVHRPDDLATPPHVGYLGSLSPLGPGERGPRGPWLVRCAPDGRLALEHVPLAPLRWEVRHVDATANSSLDGLVHDALAQAAECAGQEQVVGVEVVVEGRLPAPGTMAAQAATLRELEDDARPRVERDGVVAFLSDLSLRVRPVHDLAALAGGADVVAEVARVLRAVEDARSAPPGAARLDLVEAVGERLARFGVPRQALAWVRREGLWPSDVEVLDALWEAGLEVLDALVGEGAGR